MANTAPGEVGGPITATPHPGPTPSLAPSLQNAPTTNVPPNKTLNEEAPSGLNPTGLLHSNLMQPTKTKSAR